MKTCMPPPRAFTFLPFHLHDYNTIAIGMEDSSIQIYNVRFLCNVPYYRSWKLACHHLQPLFCLSTFMTITSLQLAWRIHQFKYTMFDLMRCCLWISLSRVIIFLHCALLPKLTFKWHALNLLQFLQVKAKLKGHQKKIIGMAFSHVLNVLVSSGADAQVYRFFYS